MANRSKLHPRNQHRGGYDFALLLAQTPELEAFVIRNPRGEQTIDFQNDQAVRMLNRALLRAHYEIEFWDIPEGYLCPPIPGRVDYIHYLADLLSADAGDIPRGPQIKALDIGTGASLVYPVTGQHEYGWRFTGVDIDAGALTSAQEIAQSNDLDIALRHQKDRDNIFRGVIKPKDLFHLTLCNPPFHSSLDKAMKGTERKWASLGKGRSQHLNFGGQNAELFCPGGEIKFIARMVEESKEFASQVVWFTCLVSKKDNLSPLRRILGRANVADVKIVDMAQGQKTSRFIAWTYMKKKQRQQNLKGT